MDPKQNKEIIRRLIDAQARGDAAIIRETLSPKLVWHSGNATTTMGRDDFLKGVEMGNQAFSDRQLVIEHALAEGDHVAALLTIRARHTGPFQDIAPTGRSFEIASMWMYRVVDHAIVEAWSLDEDVVAKLR
jgi:C-1 hydroxylase